MHPSLFILTLLPSTVLARGGRGHGGGGGSDIIGNSTSSLSFPEPIYAAIFAFCVIFAVLTALQAVQAVSNIRRRIIQQPSSITLLEFSVGPIFPAFLLLSTLFLTTAYAMHGAFYGLEYNENNTDPPSFFRDGAFAIVWNIVGFLADIFLVSGILALITHRQKVLFNTSKVLCNAKMVIDAVLIVTLLALSMSSVGLNAKSTTLADLTRTYHIYLAYISLLFVAVVDIMVSSILLYVRSRHATIDDHKVSALVFSPLLSSHLFVLAGFLVPDAHYFSTFHHIYTISDCAGGPSE